MSQLVLSASASLINAASAVLHAPSSWPSPAMGLASRIFTRAGMPPIPPMSQPLRQTSAALLRRTPEIAAFGYVLDRADADSLALWNEALAHLRHYGLQPSHIVAQREDQRHGEEQRHDQQAGIEDADED